MEEALKQKWKAAGIQVDDALPRFMNNEKMLMKYLLRFPSDENYGKLLSAMEAGDRERAFEAAHTLKGVCATLSIEGLGSQVNVLVEELRAGNMDQARERMAVLRERYQAVVEALQ